MFVVRQAQSGTDIIFYYDESIDDIHDTTTNPSLPQAFDKHMNLILVDTDEYRQIRPKKGQILNEQKRPLGFVLLRGENLCTLSVEGPPPNDDSSTTIPTMSGMAQGYGGPGQGRSAGRGMPIGQSQASRPGGLGPQGGGHIGNPGNSMDRRY